MDSCISSHQDNLVIRPGAKKTQNISIIIPIRGIDRSDGRMCLCSPALELISKHVYHLQ